MQHTDAGTSSCGFSELKVTSDSAKSVASTINMKRGLLEEKESGSQTAPLLKNKQARLQNQIKLWLGKSTEIFPTVDFWFSASVSVWRKSKHGWPQITTEVWSQFSFLLSFTTIIRITDGTQGVAQRCQCQWSWTVVQALVSLFWPQHNVQRPAYPPTCQSGILWIEIWSSHCHCFCLLKND